MGMPAYSMRIVSWDLCATSRIFQAALVQLLASVIQVSMKRLDIDDDGELGGMQSSSQELAREWDGRDDKVPTLVYISTWCS